MTTWNGYTVGMSGPAVERIRYYLSRKFQWARDMGLTEGDQYDDLTAKAVAEFQSRVGLPASGIANYATQVRLGSLIPIPSERITVFTYNGTWASSDQGFQADVARGLDPAVFRWVPLDYPSSFGPIPGGPITGVSSPSYQESVNQGVASGIGAIGGTSGKIMIGGYSQGAEAAGRLAFEVLQGQLKNRAADLVGGFVFGDPTRASGRTWPGDSLDGHGISAFNLQGAPSTWHSYAHQGDMYACVPDGVTGEDITAVYNAVTRLQVHDMIQCAEDIGAALQGKGGLLQQITDLLGNPLQLANAAQAAGIALSFVASGLRDHGTYGEDDVCDGTGRTSVQHAIDSMNAYGRAALNTAA